jgi:arylsulfate sulfotransferase
MFRWAKGLVLGALFLILSPLQGRAAMSVVLTPSMASPALVGTTVTWTPLVYGSTSVALWYRYRVQPPDGDFQMIRDFGPSSSLKWTASEHEGIYRIEVTVRNQSTGDSIEATADFEMTSRMDNNAPVISSTDNPLVFLYSAPPCPDGSAMRVHVQSTGNPENVVQTSYKFCQPGLSMNFYLAGMTAAAAYQVQHEIKTGFSSEYGPALTLAIPAISSLDVPTYKVMQQSGLSLSDGIILHSPLAQHTVATDLNGNPVWYYPETISYLTRPEPGGFFFGIYEDVYSDASKQTIRKFDLAGNTILETNAARVSEQLAALGKRSITAFHHEVQSLSEGSILALASTEQILTNVQGAGAVDVIGDMIIVLDSNLQVLWTWDAFDHLNPYRSATLGETCYGPGAGCPPFHLARWARDWLHGNSLQLTPDGSILYSSRHQDWLIKIDYRNGNGTGAILWRLGKDGDFNINSNDPSPWFSHQHDARFELGDNSILTVFDNGNVRRSSNSSAHSRGQIYRLDEANHIAELLLNGDLGVYSAALGSAQKLHSGEYHFNCGTLSNATAQSIEIDPMGNIVYSLQGSIAEYRSFRMTDLYSPYESNVQAATRFTSDQLTTRIGATNVSRNSDSARSASDTRESRQGNRKAYLNQLFPGLRPKITGEASK